jgi:hypothetical protein
MWRSTRWRGGAGRCRRSRGTPAATQDGAQVPGRARRTARAVGELPRFDVGRLKGTESAIWQLTAIDVASSFAWAELVICKPGNPTAQQTSRLAKRVGGVDGLIA